MSISPERTTDTWWRRLRTRLILLYLLIALALLIMSGLGHLRVLNELGQTFGGFLWSSDAEGLIVTSAPYNAAPDVSTALNLLSNPDHIVGIQVIRKNGHVAFTWKQGTANQEAARSALIDAYRHATVGDSITYTLQHGTIFTFPAVTFTWGLWWQNYGLALLAGLSWLLVGMVLLLRARDWVGAVESIATFPPAILFLLYSHVGAQFIAPPSPADAIFQFLWVPVFALFGAVLMHLSLTYRPAALSKARRPRLSVDGLPYLPILALLAFEWSSYLLFGQVSTRLNLLIAVSYAVLGVIVSLYISIVSLLQIRGLLLGGRERIPFVIRRRVMDMLVLWIGGETLGFGLGVLPLLLTNHPLLPFTIIFALAIIYPPILFYAIRSLRLMNRLHGALQQREELLRQQQQTAETLQKSNKELQQEFQQATSLLLRADAHLRSTLSQRLHDQPRQQALRIRSLLGHWQHKLKLEAERDPAGKVVAQPIGEALDRVRRISEELERDLQGLQLLVEDAYQRRNLGLKLHLDKLIREDLPALHQESRLKVRPDLWALDALGADLEQTEAGAKIAEAISYTVTQALLNVYKHAGASYATVRTVRTNGQLEVYISDDGRGFDPSTISPEKTSLSKAHLKAREAGGILAISSTPRPLAEHGTTVMLRLPIPLQEQPTHPLIGSTTQER